MDFLANYLSPLGMLTLASDGTGLTGLWIEGQKYFMGTLKEEDKKIVKAEDLPVLQKTVAWLDQYFAGECPQISHLPLAPKGSPFRQIVWKILCQIPYGQVMTYGEIARKTAVLQGRKTMSAQAVGGAVAHNPISIIIPCHRVVGGNGSLTGYAGGIRRKVELLNHEGVDMSRFFVPEKGTAL